MHGERQQLALYYRQHYPFDLLMRMVVMNCRMSPQLRNLGLQTRTCKMHKHFPRPTEAALRQRMCDGGALVLHLGYALPMPLDGQRDDQPLCDPEQQCRVTEKVKELVFDMDITDYLRFCGCAETKNLCHLCWLHMLGSHVILQHFVTQLLGYAEESVLWVYSGAKGLHCLINSGRALRLTAEQRQSIAQLIGGHCNKKDDSGLAAFVRDAQRDEPTLVARVESIFLKRVIEERCMLQLPAFRQFCLQKIGQLMVDVGTLWQLESAQDWKRLVQFEKAQPQLCPVRPSVWIAFRLFYPMIDEGPLRLDHLLKAAFSVHPRTNNLALPLESRDIFDFRPRENSVSLQRVLDANDGAAQYQLEKGKVLLSNWINCYNSF